ncbi:MAG TPA: hypothetical protein VGM86_26355 [Thermoanaerobaculia bacterium]
MSDDLEDHPKLPKPHTEAKFVSPDPKKKRGNQGWKQPADQAAAAASVQAKTKDDSVSAEEYKALALTPEKQWEVLVKALRLNRRSLLRIPGVTAVDVGYKIVDGSFTDELALRVHVERKLPDNSFKGRLYDCISKDRKPGQGYFQLKKYDVPMDVIEADYRPVQLSELPRPRMVLEIPKEEREVDRRKRLDPLVGGISIGSPEVPVGTLGALVWDNTDGSVCILSNWHVLAGDLKAEAGTPCFQPGRFDQGRSSDVVARLKRWSFDSQTDAAIAQLTGSRHHCAGEIVSMFQQISGVADPYLGMLVLKSGRSTGFTEGFVDGLYFSSVIEYNDGTVQVFDDQIHIAPRDPTKQISAPGDSGSVWVTESNGRGYLAVGLHFAGDLPHSTFGEFALANPMKLVADRLGFSFRPRFLEIPDEDVIPTITVEIEENGNRIEMSLNGHGDGNDLGIQPFGFLPTGLTGAGGQPDPIQAGPTGSKRGGGRGGRGGGRGR